MDREPKIATDCLPCPFCGEAPTIQQWHGGAKTKRMVCCPNDDCFVSPGVTGQTPKLAKEHWNRRKGVCDG